jgi:hypothetical protein
VEARFRKPAYGAVFSKVCVAPGKKEAFLSDLTSRGRALIEVPVDIYDRNGSHTLAAVVEWFVARKQ